MKQQWGLLFASLSSMLKQKNKHITKHLCA